MIRSIPLWLAVGLFAFLAVRYGKAKPQYVLIGVLLGVTLSSTPVGHALNDGLQTASSWVVDKATGVNS